MKIMLKVRRLIGVAVAMALVSGCASNPPVPPGVVNVTYSRALPDDGVLKETPTEVTIVTRSQTAKGVAAAVGVGALMATVGGFGSTTFSKNDLKGQRIESADRKHLRNPIPFEFTEQLGKKINAAVQQDPSLRDQQFSQPVFVAGGSVKLVYDTLISGDESFKLKTELKVWRPRNKMSPFSLPQAIDCDDASPEPLSQEKWAEEDYRLVETQLATMLQACEQKVLAELPKLLK